MRIFVCYTTKDPAVTKEALRCVEERISPYANVFIDLLHNKNGKQYRVNYELFRSDIVLHIASTDYKSEWVQKELIIARKLRKPIVKAGINELLAMDNEAIHHLIYNVDKKRWSLRTILMITLLVCIGVSIIGIWLSHTSKGQIF